MASYLARRYFRPEGTISRNVTKLLQPLMCVLQGTFAEEPQQTHFWNNKKIRQRHLFKKFKAMSIRISLDSEAGRRRKLGLPIFHIPILGGWKKYVVIEPLSHKGTWFIGWYTADGFGVSQIAVTGAIRVLVGDSTAYFFGFNQDRLQIALTQVGYGTIGGGGEFCHLPLL